MRIKFLLVTLMFIFLSCDNNKIYNEFYSNFDNNRWNPTDIRVFEFENTQSENNCDLKIHFGHIRGFQFKEVSLEVIISTPDGESEVLPINVKLIDESGKDIGDCTGDICDAFQTIKTFDSLKKGKYNVTIKSKFAGPYLPNVLGIGILLERHK